MTTPAEILLEGGRILDAGEAVTVEDNVLVRQAGE